MVSIRKDIDTGVFKFPEGFDSGLRLKDLLLDEAEEKYYIDSERANVLLNSVKDKEMLPGGINISKQGKVFDGNTEVASCLLARDHKGLGNQSMTAVLEPKVQTNYRIRKLTPLECWRLMGFTDEDYWKARKALEKEFYNGWDRSNSQMYKMAGNSIVVDVLEGIFRNLMKGLEIIGGIEE